MAGTIDEEKGARVGYPRPRVERRMPMPRPYRIPSLREHARKAQAELITGQWILDHFKKGMGILNAAECITGASGGKIEGAVNELAGSDGAIFCAPKTYSIDDDYTVPSTAHIIAGRGAIFEVAATKTLTINGTFEGDLSQHFSGDGKVVFAKGSVKEFYPQWFGAKGDATTDDRNALQATFNAARAVSGTVIITSGDYKVCQTPLALYAAGIDIISRGGKIWNSLPDDYTFNINDYSSWTETHVLNKDGDYVDVTHDSVEGVYPWNGKGEMFAYTTGIIGGLEVDGGWGTTGVPGTVHPIVGIKDSPGTEFIHYMMWKSPGADTLYDSCIFTNCPGAYIEGGATVRTTPQNCTFGEYGDHVFYFGLAGQHMTFSTNRIIATRAQVSTWGEADYVGTTKRDALKFRGCTYVGVHDNQVNIPTAKFITLEVLSSQGGDTELVAISDNEVNCGTFLEILANRDASVSGGHTGYTLKNVLINDNAIKVATRLIYAGISPYAAIRNLIFDDNVVECPATVVMNILSNPQYEEGIRDLIFRDNDFWLSNTSDTVLMGLGGIIKRLEFADNRVYSIRTAQGAQQSLIQPTVVSGTLPLNIGELIVKDNILENWYSYWYDYGGFPAWVSNQLYTYTETVQDDFTQVMATIVNYNNVLYRNKAEVQSATAPPSDPTNWEVYTRPPMRFELQDNTKISTANSLHLTYITAISALQGQLITLYHTGNVNRGAAEAYGTTNVYSVQPGPRVRTRHLTIVGPSTFTNGDTTPDVGEGNFFQTLNTGATVITNFDNGVAGQVLIVRAGDAVTTIQDGGTLLLAGNFVMAANQTMTLISLDGTYWIELTRSVN